MSPTILTKGTKEAYKCIGLYIVHRFSQPLVECKAIQCRAAANVFVWIYLLQCWKTQYSNVHCKYYLSYLLLQLVIQTICIMVLCLIVTKFN